MSKNKIILFSILLTAFLVRVFVIWIDRPEFVGWFNHTYYYFVEVKGLLENGKLPFPDMPLLFYIYAYSSKLLILIGMDDHNAIVVSTRFWMSIIPSLIVIPVYLILKSINYEKPFEKWNWILVSAGAFLPLSILHIPEFSQKTALGLLLLAVFILVTKRTLTSKKIKDILLSAFVFTLIVLTHFGTTAVAVLYVISLFAVQMISGNKLRSVIFYVGMIFALTAISSLTIYFIDIQRFERILYYLQHSFGSSFTGILLSPDSNMSQKLEAIAVIMLPILIVLFFLKLYKNNNSNLSDENRMFWLCNIIFFYLLMLPVYDQLLIGRFVLYLSLPILIILKFVLSYSVKNIRIKRVVLVLIILGTAFMTFGEFMSLKLHNKDKDEIFADLMLLKNQQNFQKNDLIITKNGAEHICNWFLGTKSGMITSLNQNDFNKYENIYILNPIEGELNFEGIENKSADNETDRYLFMMRNIPGPENSKTVYKSEYIELLKIDEVPSNWEFDKKGNWKSYGN